MRVCPLPKRVSECVGKREGRGEERRGGATEVDGDGCGAGGVAALAARYFDGELWVVVLDPREVEAPE